MKTKRFQNISATNTNAKIKWKKQARNSAIQIEKKTEICWKTLQQFILYHLHGNKENVPLTC